MFVAVNDPAIENDIRKYDYEMPDVRMPHPLFTFTEVSRAMVDYAALKAATPLLNRIPRVKGINPVLVLPGLATGDQVTKPLRRFLASKGFRVYGWRLGINRGPATVGFDGRHIVERVQRIYDRWGEPVSLVGWSLGGMIARELSKLHPDHVRMVITLGSPICGVPNVSTVTWLYELLSGHKPPMDEAMCQHIARPSTDVPCTSVFSYSDGIVPWQNSVQPVTEITENVAVQCSHFGIGLHPAVYYLVADRLAQAKGGWEPFIADDWRARFFKQVTHVGEVGDQHIEDSRNAPGALVDQGVQAALA
ncbi:MAG: alpha/beta fold hydrolase [Pseudomonadota bacterium]